jgi:AraC-like DNA-binding protein
MHWRDSVCRAYSVTNCSRLGDGRFAGEFQGRPFGGIGVGKIRSTPLRYTRDHDDIRANPVQNYMLMLMLEGKLGISQDDRTAVANPGDLVIYNQDKPFSLDFDEGYSALTFVLPEAMISCRSWRQLSGSLVRIGGDSANGRFATGLLKQFSDISVLDHLVSEDRIVAGALDLICGAIGVGIDPGPNDRFLDSVKAYIVRNLEDAELDLEKIAKANGVSPRTLNRLFASQNITPIGWLWNRRLDASYEALKLGRVANVTEAAFSFGFKSVSHFSGAFKKRFGISPSRAS